MKIKTKWTPTEDKTRWDLYADINFNNLKLYFYLASIEPFIEPGIVGKKIYIVTDLFGEYHPDAGQYFGEKFRRLKDAKAWVENKTIEGLTEIVKLLKALGK